MMSILLKEKTCQPRIMCPAKKKKSFKNEGKMKTFKQTEAEKIPHQETYTERNIKESSVGAPTAY